MQNTITGRVKPKDGITIQVKVIQMFELDSQDVYVEYKETLS